MNDVWRYDATLSAWYYITGSSLLYGPSSSSTPSAMTDYASFVDNDSGDLYIFGGQYINEGSFNISRIHMY
jgi:hypothetical protein